MFREKVTKNMKKFTFKGVLDGFRSTVQPQTRPEQEIQETLRSDNFLLKKVSFPFNPAALYCFPLPFCG